MKVCASCGAEYEDDADFCQKCGSQLQDKMPDSVKKKIIKQERELDNTPHMYYCSQCSLTYSGFGNENAHCKHCGGEVRETTILKDTWEKCSAEDKAKIKEELSRGMYERNKEILLEEERKINSWIKAITIVLVVIALIGLLVLFVTSVLPKLVELAGALLFAWILGAYFWGPRGRYWW